MRTLRDEGQVVWQEMIKKKCLKGSCWGNKPTRRKVEWGPKGRRDAPGRPPQKECPVTRKNRPFKRPGPGGMGP